MRFFWALVLTFFLTDFIYAQRNARIGFLNIDKVLTSHRGFSESSQDLETKIMSWRNEIDQRQKELNEQSKALKLKGIYSQKKSLKNVKMTSPLSRIN